MIQSIVGGYEHRSLLGSADEARVDSRWWRQIRRPHLTRAGYLRILSSTDRLDGRLPFAA